MAEELIIPRLKFEELTQRSLDEWTVEYESETDTLYMWLGVQRAATSVDLHGEIWARVDPATGEVLGFEIEAFRDVFLVRHPELPRPSAAAAPARVETEGWVTTFVAFLRRAPWLEGPTTRRADRRPPAA